MANIVLSIMLNNRALKKAQFAVSKKTFGIFKVYGTIDKRLQGREHRMLKLKVRGEGEIESKGGNEREEE